MARTTKTKAVVGPAPTDGFRRGDRVTLLAKQSRRGTVLWPHRRPTDGMMQYGVEWDSYTAGQSTHNEPELRPIVERGRRPTPDGVSKVMARELARQAKRDRRRVARQRRAARAAETVTGGPPDADERDDARALAGMAY